MITKKEYEALLNYFEVNAIPENLVIFVEKLKLLYKSLVIAEEYQNENIKINEELAKLTRPEEK